MTDLNEMLAWAKRRRDICNAATELRPMGRRYADLAELLVELKVRRKADPTFKEPSASPPNTIRAGSAP